jgi:hypothetical protein
MKKGILFLLIFLPFYGFSTTTQVTGYGKITAGRTLRLLNYKDYLTRVTDTLQVVKGDAEGHFTFSFQLTKSVEVMLNFDRFFYKLYIQPGQDIDLLLSTNGSDIQIKTEGESRRNFIIGEIDKDILHFRQSYMSLDEKMFNQYYLNVDIFLPQLFEKYKGRGDDFTKEYLEYQAAKLEFDGYTWLEDKGKINALLDRMLYSAKPASDNPAYYEFIKSVAEKTYKFKKMRKLTGNKIKNPYLSRLKAAEIFDRDPYRKLADLYAIIAEYSVVQAYHNQDAEKRINEILSSGQPTWVTACAKNTKEFLAIMNKGSQPPVFYLNDQFRKEQSSANYKGQYVVLQFFKYWNGDSKQNVRGIKKINESLTGKVQFISVSMDESPFEYWDYISGKERSWPFVYIGSRSPYVNSFQIYGFNRIIILDRNGKIYNSDFKSIDKNALPYFESLP